MCGICGIAIPERLNRGVIAARLERMRDVITHRGPDDAGAFIDGGIGLGHRRLSIVDVAGGHQPMTNEDGTVRIVFNGEIYNHASLRDGLLAKGHRYANHSDTETIVHLYEERGLAALDDLSGMFAFALWDAPRGLLLLARDRMGIKPLYYHHAEDGTLHFGSEIKTILAAGAIGPEVNLAALPDYLANHAPSGEETLYRGIRRLPAGHYLTWEKGAIAVRRYWDASFRPFVDAVPLTDAQYVDAWRGRFEEAVRSHLMADVPLGVFLSGGIDSSAIAAMMARHVREPIKTFSVAFAEREANELEYARVVSRAFGTDHHEVIVTPQQYFDALPRLIWHEDEPIGHLASVPLYFLSALAVKHVKVVLTGEGSDELLAGYGRYGKTVRNLAWGRRYQALMPEPVRRLVQGALAGFAPARIADKLGRTFLFRDATLDQLYFDNFAVFPRAMQDQLFTPGAKAAIGNLDPYRTVRAIVEGSDARLLDRLLYADLKTYLHELLMKQDQMSMAASLESRVPFLDHELVEFSLRLPERMKFDGRTTKRVLREAMRDILPRQILERPKMGFPVPLGAWFRGPYRHIVEDCVLGERAMARGLFDHSNVRKLVNEHTSGERDHAQRLWSLVNLELWMRQAIDGDPMPTTLSASVA